MHSDYAGTPIVYMVVEFQGSKYLFSTQPAIRTSQCRLRRLFFFFLFIFVLIIDGRTIEYGLYEISSFEVSALYTARLLSSLSLFIFVIYFCYIIIGGRIIEYGPRLRSNRTLHSPPITKCLCLYK